MESLEAILRLYDSLHPTAWALLSFQIKRKEYGTQYKIGLLTEVWGDMDNRINQIFGTKRDKITYMREAQRGVFPVYVWTEGNQDQGELHSFGMAHPDGAYRANLHYFSVAANLNLLNKVAETFVEEPENMSRFVAQVFGWENEPPVKCGFGNNPYSSYKPEPELFAWMNELHVYTPHLGVRKVTPHPI